MRLPLFVSRLADIDLVLAGHYGSSGGDSRGGGDGGGGLGAPWVVAALVVAAIAVGVLVWLDPSGARARLRKMAPKALIAIVIAAPLVAWTASAGGDEKRLVVERWRGIGGAPELLISLADQGLNTLATTNGRRVVGVECVRRDGHVILDAEQEWPFLKEPGYDYPHAHQSVSGEQLQQAERCRLRGTRVALEADVEGALKP